MNGSEGKRWICLVCGYVHYGPEPPESCPICGAPREDFELREERMPAPKEAARPKPGQWRCLVCNYIHAGEGAPEACATCGALANNFEPLEEAPAPGKTLGRPVRVVVIGAGIAGVSAAEAARAAAPDAEITLVSKEDALPYYRLNLTRYLAGEVTEDALPLHPASWYADQRIRLLRGVAVTAIRPDEHEIELEGGAKEPFEKLVIAAGAHPFVPPIRNASVKGAAAFRTIEDAAALLDAAQPGVECVVIGGGILGLETAGGLARRGAHVTVLEGYDWLLPRQLNQEAGAILERHVARLGIALRYRAKTVEITGTDHIRGVLLDDGTLLRADLAVMATGIRSNTHLARDAGLDANQGIVVNASLTTSHPDIFAAGDVAEHEGTVYGLWEPARYQGTIAGMNAVGVATEFGGLPRANALKVLGVDLFSVGVVMPQDGSYDVISQESNGGSETGRYHRFLFRDGRLMGAILLGDARLAAAATKATKNRTDFSGMLRRGPTVADILAALEQAGS